MINRLVLLMVAVILMISTSVLAETYSIPADKQDAKKVFWGTATNFQKPAKVDYEKVIRATPEFVSIKKNKIDQGSAKFWILMSKATDHAIRLIATAAKEGKYDFIAASNYLGSLQPVIPADDITDLVLQKMEKER
jgi:hypothetical protein